MRSGRVPTAVLFDLDDTLFDHSGAARAALTRVHGADPLFARWPFDAFAETHARVLEELHLEVLTGARSVDEARVERFRRLYAEAGASENPALTAATAARYRTAYLGARRAVDGARSVLAALAPVVRVGIVSNNVFDEQQAKLALCGFDGYVHALIVSEAVGVAKPDPAIFGRALEDLGCTASDAVMIGDSWAADVEGARAAGIRPIWFNPARRPRPDAGPDAANHVQELAALEPIDAVMAAIFGGDWPSDFGAEHPCASA